MPNTIRGEGLDPIVCEIPAFLCAGLSEFALARRARICGGETMTIYLMQGSDDGTRVDEIEGKLKSTIPELKRVPSLEDIDELAIDGVERSTVVLVAAAPEIGTVAKSNRHCQTGARQTFSSSSLAAIFPPAITSGSFNPETPTGSPMRDFRRKFLKLSGGSARPRETIPRLNHRSSFRSFRARGESAIPRSRSKPRSILSGTSRQPAPASRSWISISSRATSATTST